MKQSFQELIKLIKNNKKETGIAVVLFCICISLAILVDLSINSSAKGEAINNSTVKNRDNDNKDYSSNDDESYPGLKNESSTKASEVVTTSDSGNSGIENNQQTTNTQQSTTSTNKPAEDPTQKTTQKPTQKPTQSPTQEPTEEPTQAPTQAPTEEPTQAPTQAPTEAPKPEVFYYNGREVSKTAYNILNNPLNEEAPEGTTLDWGYNTQWSSNYYHLIMPKFDHNIVAFEIDGTYEITEVYKGTTIVNAYYYWYITFSDNTYVVLIQPTNELNSHYKG